MKFVTNYTYCFAKKCDIKVILTVWIYFAINNALECPSFLNTYCDANFSLKLSLYIVCTKDF